METQFIEWLRSQVSRHPRVPLGIGDDAAVVDLPAGKQWVVTTDMLMDDVDFHVGQHEPARIGRKSLAVNLSDLAAMGARPVACFVSVALPRQGGGELARAIYEGVFALARQFDTAIGGGDTNSWDGKLVINVTAVGEVETGKAWQRSGARAGDQILVTGEFGGSILGKHFDFTPRVAEAIWLAENAQITAAIDVSDGLSLDLSRICQESGCGAVLDLNSIPIAVAAANQADKLTPLEHALGDGEDFELILAVAADEAERLLTLQPLAVPLTRIGQFVAEPGLWSQMADGTRAPLAPRGYEHRLAP
ncbi:MAG TPA: thiamine-phosphate kinase [Pirellulaceae bacterium]|nr:thiamine-phosphate kinase [Pirellulaceae bacterium]